MERYRAYERKRRLLGYLLGASLLVAAAVSLQLGVLKLPLGALLQNPVMWEIRLPRIASALLVGAALGISGAVMQCVLRNPLASPFTLGISSGAAFGAAVAIVFFGAGQLNRTGLTGVIIDNPYSISAFAFLFALGAVLVILALVKLRQITPTAMILAGVAISSFFQAATMLIQLFAEDVKVAAVVFWTFGDVGRTNWGEIVIMSVAFSMVFLHFFRRRWELNVMLGGDETAKSLGVEPSRFRLEVMILGSLLTALSVSFSGIIGFVGLIAPHAVRLMIGADHRYLIPYSALIGALVLLLSDTVGRIAISPAMIPVGIVTAFLGVPIFLYLLIRSGSYASDVT
ncbi:MAG: iron ABC transporter permease [Deltaproteobacteria bacterium]|nr:MAG: iron ABC transporter permease [Deltaproteobacteria bacterium]